MRALFLRKSHILPLHFSRFSIFFSEKGEIVAQAISDYEPRRAGNTKEFPQYPCRAMDVSLKILYNEMCNKTVVAGDALIVLIFNYLSLFSL